MAADAVSIAGGGNVAINAVVGPCIVGIYDQRTGGPINNAAVQFVMSSNSGGAGGSFPNVNVNTDTNGQASCGNVTVNGNVGTWRITANIFEPGVYPSSIGFDYTSITPPRNPTTIAATAGSAQSAQLGATFPVAMQVQVKDQFGVGLPGIAVTFSSPGAGSSCTWGGSHVAGATTDASGFATASAAVASGSVGNFNVQAYWTTGGNGPVINMPQTVLSNTPPVLSSFTVNGSGQVVPINTAFPTALAATIQDQFGQPMAGLAVSFTCPASGASGTFAGATRIFNGTTNSLGIVTAPVLTSNATGGAFVCTVAQGAFTRPINLTIATGAPVATSIVPLQGNNQSAQVNTQFAVNIYARVNDQYGNPIAGVAIASSVPGTGASCTGLSGAGVSDGSGNFFVGRPTANAVVGSYLITTSVTALSATALPSNPFADRPRPRPVVPGVDVPDDGMPPQFSPRAFPSCTFNCTNTVGPPVPAQASLLSCDY